MGDLETSVLPPMPLDSQQAFLKDEESSQQPPCLLLVRGSLQDRAWPALSWQLLWLLSGFVEKRVSLYQITGLLRNGPRDHLCPPGAEICYH